MRSNITQLGQLVFGLALALTLLPGCNNGLSGRIRYDRPLVPLARFDGHTAPVTSVAFNHLGTLAVSGSVDRTARLWFVQATTLPGPAGGEPALPSGLPLTVYVGHVDAVQAVAISPDSTQVATASRDRSVIVWDLRTGDIIRRLDGHLDWVMSVSFFPDGQHLLTSGRDKTVRVWDLSTGEQIRQFNIDLAYDVEFSVVSPDGRRVLADGSDRVMWDVGATLPISVSRHAGRTRSVAFAPDSSKLLYTLKDGVNVRSVVPDEFVQLLWQPEKRVSSATFAVGDRRVVAGYIDGRIWVFDLRTKKELMSLVAHADRVNALATTPDGRMVISGGEDHTVRLWAVGF